MGTGEVEARQPVRPERASWRCSNCGEETELKEGYVPLDPRYGIGKCGSCSLRGDVPLMFTSRAEAIAVVETRRDRDLFAKQLIGLRAGTIPHHVYHRKRDDKCCPLPVTAHLTKDRLEELFGTLGRKP